MPYIRVFHVQHTAFFTVNLVFTRTSGAAIGALVSDISVRVSQSLRVPLTLRVLLVGYAGDISRVWPVNGRFTDPQREVYEAVLRVQEVRAVPCGRRGERGSARETGQGSAARKGRGCARRAGWEGSEGRW